MQITDHVPNLVGGITQQPPETRIKTAVEEMVNAYPSAVQGLSKRRGAQFVSSLTSTALGTTSFHHTIDRDEFEKYIVVTNSDGTVEVYDLDGTQEDVTIDTRSQEYLQTTDPSKNIRAVTVGDYTFIVNREKTALLEPKEVDATATATPRIKHFLKYRTLERNSVSFWKKDPVRSKASSYEAFLELSYEHINTDSTVQTFTWNPFEDFRDIGQDYEFHQLDDTTNSTYEASGTTINLGRNMMALTRCIPQLPWTTNSGNWEMTADMFIWKSDGSDPYYNSDTYFQNLVSGTYNQYQPIGGQSIYPVGGYTMSQGTAINTKPFATNGYGTASMAHATSKTGWNANNNYVPRNANQTTGSRFGIRYFEMFASRLNGRTKTFTATDGTQVTLTITGVTRNTSDEIEFTTNVPVAINAAYEDFGQIGGISVTLDALTYDNTADFRNDPSKFQSFRPAAYSGQTQFNREICLAHPRTLADGTKEIYTLKYIASQQNHTTLANNISNLQISGTDGDGVAFVVDFAATTYNAGTGRIEIVATDDFYIDSINEYYSGTPYSKVQSSYASKSMTDFDDLPDQGAVGEVVRISGQSDDGTDDYYVQWNGSRWEETVGFGQGESLDVETMPQVLVRQSSGSWTLSPHTWLGRTVGDSVSNETPSFVNNRINDIFLFQGRLGICAGESIVLSEVDFFEQFYRSTCVQLEDDNRIDVQLNFGRVEKPHAALAVQDNLILFSDKGQFRMYSGSGVLTPKTASVIQIGDYSTSTNVRPHAIGKSAFFTSELGGFTVAREFFLGAATDDRLLSSDLTIQCPQYVAGDARYIQASRDNKILFVLSRNDPTAIYVHKFEYDGEQKVQSAWCKWELGVGTIESFGLFQNYLYIVSSLGSERELSKIDIRDQKDIPGTELMRLDLQVVPVLTDTTVYSRGVTGNEETPETEITIPFDGTDLVECWDLSDGHTIPIDSFTSSGDLILKGDFTDKITAGRVIVGIPYTMDVKLSTFYRRAPRKPSGEIVVTDGRLTINYINIAYSDTVAFSVETSTRGRATKTYNAGPRVGYVDVEYGEVPKTSGNIRVPIMTRNDNAEIRIKNDTPFGSTILHVDWFGKHNPRARRV